MPSRSSFTRAALATKVAPCSPWTRAARRDALAAAALVKHPENDDASAETQGNDERKEECPRGEQRRLELSWAWSQVRLWVRWGNGPFFPIRFYPSSESFQQFPWRRDVKRARLLDPPLLLHVVLPQAVNAIDKTGVARGRGQGSRDFVVHGVARQMAREEAGGVKPLPVINIRLVGPQAAVPGPHSYRSRGIIHSQPVVIGEKNRPALQERGSCRWTARGHEPR